MYRFNFSTDSFEFFILNFFMNNIWNSSGNSFRDTLNNDFGIFLNFLLNFIVFFWDIVKIFLRHTWYYDFKKTWMNLQFSFAGYQFMKIIASKCSIDEKLKYSSFIILYKGVLGERWRAHIAYSIIEPNKFRDYFYLNLCNLVIFDSKDTYLILDKLAREKLSFKMLLQFCFMVAM